MNHSLRMANTLMRRGDYRTAITIYNEILGSPAPQSLLKSVEFNIWLANRYLLEKSYSKNSYIGEQCVTDIAEALTDLDNCNRICIPVPGISALVRAKNASQFITGSIESVVDLVDEIVVVDNNSSDDTYSILERLATKYTNVKLYKYMIDVPKVGIEHERALELGSSNTLGTYYNWCLSKVTRTNVLKWDADFIALRGNLINLIRRYNLHNSDEDRAIWCTGITAYNGKHLNIDSHYDEYRIFSKKYGAHWENWRGCETLTPSINRTPRLHIHPSELNVKKYDSLGIGSLKMHSPPVFIEVKEIANLKPDAMVLDERDRIDNYFISRYCSDHPEFHKPNLINYYTVLIVIPSIEVGGGNIWAIYIYESLRYLGVSVVIGIKTSSKQLLSETLPGRFSAIDRSHIIEFDNSDALNVLNQYTHSIITTPLDVDTSKLTSKVYAFTHSEVSVFNRYIMSSGLPAIGLNQATVSKFVNNGIPCKLLRNYVPNYGGSRVDSLPRTNHNLLYCNRITSDKNVLMLLVAFKMLLESFDGKIRLTILAGGSDTNRYEYDFIKAAANFLELGSAITILQSQTDVASYYANADLVVLPSVSEGCSLGLLESISHEIPILSTDIAANTEVVRGLQPHFTFDGLRSCIEATFAVAPEEMYSPFLEAVGYASISSFHRMSDDGSVKYSLIEHYHRFMVDPQVDAVRSIKFICPYFIDDAYLRRLSGTSLGDYLHHQRSVFLNNSKILSGSISRSLADLGTLRKNVRSLKALVAEEYFSRSHHIREVANVIFDELNFITLDDYAKIGSAQHCDVN